MIKFLKKLLQAVEGKQMVKGRGQIEQNERAAINCGTDNMPDIAEADGCEEERDEPYESETSADSMSNAISKFFFKRIFVALWTVRHGVSGGFPN